MYGKITNGDLITAPEKYLKYTKNNKNIIVCNPQSQHYLAAGYKPVEYGEIPNNNLEDYNLNYVEYADKIMAIYV